MTLYHPCCTDKHCTAGCLSAGQHQWAGVAWCFVLHYSTSDPSCVCVCVCSAALYTGSVPCISASLLLAYTASKCVCICRLLQRPVSVSGAAAQAGLVAGRADAAGALMEGMPAGLRRIAGQAAQLLTSHVSPICKCNCNTCIRPSCMTAQQHFLLSILPGSAQTTACAVITILVMCAVHSI